LLQNILLLDAMWLFQYSHEMLAFAEAIILLIAPYVVCIRTPILAETAAIQYSRTSEKGHFGSRAFVLFFGGCPLVGGLSHYAIYSPLKT